MDNLHNDVFEAIAAYSRLATDIMPLEAIWLDKPLQTARKRTSRITKGDMVRVIMGCDGQGEEASLADCTDGLPPTHLILECKGTIYSGDLQIVCEDLDTQHIIIVKL